MTPLRRLCALIVMAMSVFCTGSADAQTAVQGTVTRDGAIIWATNTSVPLVTARSGQVLQVTGQSERWYEVRVPEQLGGHGELGLIARTQVQLAPGSPAPPTKALRGDSQPSQRPQPARPTGSRAAQPPPARRPRRFPVGYVAVSAALQTRAESFDETVTFDANVEQGQRKTTYSPATAWGLSVAALRQAKGPLAFGAEFEGFKRSTPAVFTASIPHPFFFATPRLASMDVNDLDQTQIGMHFHVGGLWFPGKHVHVSVRGGPSLFYVKQGIVADFSYTDTYPYDTVTLQGVTPGETDGWHIGFNVGGDAGYSFGRRTGVGVSVSYSRADLELETTNSQTMALRAGGISTSAGLRIRF